MRNKISKQAKVGEFEIKSGKVMVSDPCYNKKTWCQGTIDNIKKGKWIGEVVMSDEGTWGNRVAYLIAYHNGCKNIDYESSNWIDKRFEVGVDSGQAGIFDYNDFHGGEKGNDDYEDRNSWYRKCCDLTCNGSCSGVIEGGIVSSSGCGDGGYKCRVIEEKGKVVAILIDYGLMEEEEDWGEEDEDYIEN